MESNAVTLYRQLENSMDLDNIDETMQVLSKSVLKYILYGKVTNEIQGFKSGFSSLSKLAQSLDFENEKAHRESFLLGYIKSGIDLVNVFDQDNDSSDLPDLEILESYEHLENMLTLLYKENSLSHQKLAEAMKITQSNLSNFNKRIESYELVETRKIGKMKYYNITPYGRRLYKKFCSNKLVDKNNDIEIYTDFLLEMLDALHSEIVAPVENYTRMMVRIESSYKNFPIYKENLFRHKLTSILEDISSHKRQFQIVEYQYLDQNEQSEVIVYE